MELHQLRYALAVLKTGNFSRAAIHCHVSQPSLSQQIQKLEEELGVSLLVRQGRGVRPTEAGAMGVVGGLVLAALHGRAGLADFTEAALKDKATRAFHDKVKMVLDPVVDGAYPKRWLGHVTATTKDGRKLEYFDNGVVSEKAILFLHGTPGDATVWNKWLSEIKICPR